MSFSFFEVFFLSSLDFSTHMRIISVDRFFNVENSNFRSY